VAHSRQRVEPIRVDPNQILLDTPSGFDMRLFANEEVPIDRASLAEAAAMSEIASTVSDLDQRGFFGEEGGEVMRAVFTPDFHKATGIPVGSVLETRGLIFPKAAGSDIGCGMRLIATDLSEDEFARIGPGLDGLLRHVLFEGGRNIPLHAGAREAILRDGVQGLRAPQGGGGIWDQITPAVIDAEVAACHGGGRWQTSDIWRFGDFVRGSGGVSRDSQSGSLSGGNHFLEIGVVDEVMDRGAGWSWGLKRGFVTIMVHNGSLGLGGMVAEHFMDRARAIQPKDIAKPGHGFDPLPTAGPLAGEGWAYLNAMGLAANFAVVNRLMLGMMAIDALGRAAGR